MKCYKTLAALAAIAPGVFAMTINTPSNVVECQPSLFSWTDGVSPYWVTILPGGQASATPLRSFPQTSAMAMTWNVDIPAGTSITIALKDSTGAQAFTDTVTTQKGTDSSCTSGGGGGAAAPAPAPASGPASNPAVTTPQAADTTDNTSVSVSDNSGASSTSAPASSAAPVASVASTRAATAPAGAASSAVRAGTTAVAAASTARGSASVVAVASASASRAATGATSGAGARYSVNGMCFAGLVGLVGAMFL